MKSKSYSLKETVTFPEVFEDLQDIYEYNLKQFLELVILEPGLKVKEDEFECTLIGHNLYIIPGPVVFPNYEIFIPGTKEAVSIDLSEYSGNSDKLYVYIQYDEDEENRTHPYPTFPSSSGSISSDILQVGGAKFILAEPGSVGLTDKILIAMVEIGDDGEWDVDNYRFINSLKISRAYPPITPNALILHKPENVEISTTNLVTLRPPTAMIAGASCDINRQSSKNNINCGAYVTVSWDAPDTSGIALYGGFLMYKVRFIAMDGAVELEQCTIEKDVIVFSDYDDDRVYCNALCSEGVTYKASIRLIGNFASLIHSYAVETSTVVAGASSSASAAIGATLTLTPQFDTGRVVKISSNLQSGPFPSKYQLFVYDRKVGETSTPSDSQVLASRCLFYEGKLSDVTYIAEEETESIYCIGRVIGPGEKIIQSTSKTYIDVDEQESTDTYIWPIYFPEDSAAAVADQLLWSFVAPRDFSIDRLVTTGNGETVGSGTIWVYEENQLYSDGYYVDYDAEGDGDQEQTSVGTIFRSGQTVHISAVSGGGTDVSRCVLYMHVKVIG